MQVTVEKLSDLEHCLTVTVPAEDIEKEVQKKLKEIALKAKIPGFRPGKIPASMIQKRFGDSARADVVDVVLRDTYGKALDQEKLRPAGYPRIDIKNIKLGEPFSYTAKIEVYPEIKLANLSKVEVEKKVCELADKNVDDVIDQLRKEQVDWKEIVDPNRLSQKGDQLTVDFTVIVHTDAPPEPKHEQGVKFVLGDGQMWAEFEKPLFGHRTGNEVKFTLKFPDTHADKEMVGKKADFSVRVRKVCEPVMPELNDKFAKKFGYEENGVEKLKAEVRKNLERGLQRALSNSFKDAMMKKLLELHSIPVPKALVEGELENMKERWKENYAKYAGKAAKDVKDAPGFSAEKHSDEAKRSVTLGLLMAQIIKDQQIKVEPQELRAKVEELTSVYEDAAKVADQYYHNRNRMLEVESMLLEEKAFAYLEGQVKVVAKPIGYDELMLKK